MTTGIWFFSVCAGLIGQCGYYDCLATRLNCAPESVIRAKARPYCARFEENAHLHTPAGRRALHGIKSCLQNEIERRDPQDCGTADHIFIEAHISCYVQNDYCGLGLADRALIGKVAWPALLDSRFREALYRISEECRR